MLFPFRSPTKGKFSHKNFYCLISSFSLFFSCHLHSMFCLLELAVVRQGIIIIIIIAKRNQFVQKYCRASQFLFDYAVWRTITKNFVNNFVSWRILGCTCKAKGNISDGNCGNKNLQCNDKKYTEKLYCWCIYTVSNTGWERKNLKKHKISCENINFHILKIL